MVTPKAEHGEIFIVCQYIVILHVQVICFASSSQDIIIRRQLLYYQKDISIRIWF